MLSTCFGLKWKFLWTFIRDQCRLRLRLYNEIDNKKQPLIQLRSIIWIQLTFVGLFDCPPPMILYFFFYYFFFETTKIIRRERWGMDSKFTWIDRNWWGIEGNRANSLVIRLLRSLVRSEWQQNWSRPRPEFSEAEHEISEIWRIIEGNLMKIRVSNEQT